MNERDLILGRIREGLQYKAPQPGAHGNADAAHAESRPSEQARAWLPLGGSTFEEQLACFQAASTDLKTEFILLPSGEQFSTTVRQLCEREGWKHVASHRSPLTKLASDALGQPVLWTDDGYEVDKLEVCDVGITTCDALIAQTGSVLVTSRSTGGRALTVLPPHHLVLARREQLLPDLTAAFELVKQKYGTNLPSMISLITGPSRTGDIERILVLGAHGPKKLTIVCF